MFGFYKFENFYLGNISRINPHFEEWPYIKDVKIGDKTIRMGTDYSYPTLLLKKSDKNYVDLIHQGRLILMKENKYQRCYVLNYTEPVGNYFPQDMLENKKYLTKKQAIEYFSDYIIDFNENNTKKNEVKIFVYKKNDN